MDANYYECPSCGKKIAILSKTVHEIHCVPPPDSNSPLPLNNQQLSEQTGLLSHSATPTGQQHNVYQPNFHDLSSSHMNIETDDDHWQCLKCTFAENTYNTIECEMCGTMNPLFIDSPDRRVPSSTARNSTNNTTQDSQNMHEKAETSQSTTQSTQNDSNFIDMSVSPPLSTRHSNSNLNINTNSNSWRCETCTYDNMLSDDSCSMCGTTRPVQQAYRDRLITEDDTEFIRPVNTYGGGRDDYYYDNQQQQQHNASSDLLAPSATTGMLLGGGVGAALAWLNNRSVTEGAVAGAGMGLLGSMLMQDSVDISGNNNNNNNNYGYNTSSSSRNYNSFSSDDCHNTNVNNVNVNMNFSGSNHRRAANNSSINNNATTNGNNNAAGGSSSFLDDAIFTAEGAFDSDDEAVNDFALPDINNSNRGRNNNASYRQHPLQEIFGMHDNTLRSRAEGVNSNNRNAAINVVDSDDDEGMFGGGLFHPLHSASFPPILSSTGTSRSGSSNSNRLRSTRGTTSSTASTAARQQAARQRQAQGYYGTDVFSQPNSNRRSTRSNNNRNNTMIYDNGMQQIPDIFLNHPAILMQMGGVEGMQAFLQTLNNGGGGQFIFNVGDGGDDTDTMTYEQLLERFQQPVRATDETNISALPTRIYQPTSDANTSTATSTQPIDLTGSPPSKRSAQRETPGKNSSSSSNSTAKSGEHESCAICLEPYKGGDEIKTLPCLHSYHSQCIESWLRQSRLCPVCKFSIV